MLELEPVYLTIIMSMFAFLITSLGSAVVLLFKKINKNLMHFILSFAAGVMIASSFFSLILVAIDRCSSLHQSAGVVCTIGMVLGFGFIIFMELYVDKKLHRSGKFSKYVNDKNKESVMTFFAISLHNIPEGMCIGVAFAGASVAGTSGAVVASMLLAFGIAVQNFPEGSSVSLPLYNSGISKRTSFLLGVLSGFVEPVFAIIGFFAAMAISAILPMLLTFSAGTMIAVSCCDLLPESMNENKKVATIGLGLGFCFMMLLDLLL